MSNPVAPPNFDGVLWPGPGGMRVPTEVFGSVPGGPGGTIDLVKPVTVTPGAATSVTLTNDQTAASEITIGTASGGAVTLNLSAAIPGKSYILYNNSGTTVTFKVTSQTGVAVGTGKRAILVCETTDIARVTADT